VSFNESTETFGTHRVHAIRMIPVITKMKNAKKSLTFLF